MQTSIGALWVKEGKKGQFLSGKLDINGEKISVVAFKNKKTKENQPDYRIFVSSPQQPSDATRYEEVGY